MEIVYGSKIIVLPDFLIVGVAKAATTAIYYALKQHPDVRMPNLKEPRFLSYWNSAPNFINPATGQPVKGIITDLDDYLALFSSLSNKKKLIGEASTSYMYTAENVIDNMRVLYGEKMNDVKIVIVLRHPVERIWSQYNMHIRDDQETETLLDAVPVACTRKRLLRNWPAGFDYIGYSLYAKKIRLFKNNFRDVSISFHEDVGSKWSDSIRDLVDFLGVDPQFECKQKRHNVSGAPKNSVAGEIASFIYGQNKLKYQLKRLMPISLRHYFRTRLSSVLFKSQHIPPDIYNQLLEIFRDDILETQEITGRDLSAWLARK